jgi:hypothetical protein
MTHPYRFAGGEGRLLWNAETPRYYEGITRNGGERIERRGPADTARDYMARMGRITGTERFIREYRRAQDALQFQQRWAALYQQPYQQWQAAARARISFYEARAERRERPPLVDIGQLNERLARLYTAFKARPELKQSFRERYTPLYNEWFTATEGRKQDIAVLMDRLAREYEEKVRPPPSPAPAPSPIPKRPDPRLEVTGIPGDVRSAVDGFNDDSTALATDAAVVALPGGQFSLTFFENTQVNNFTALLASARRTGETWTTAYGTGDGRLTIKPVSAEAIRRILTKLRCKLPDDNAIKLAHRDNSLVKGVRFAPTSADAFTARLIPDLYVDPLYLRDLLVAREFRAEVDPHFPIVLIRGMTAVTLAPLLRSLTCAFPPASLCKDYNRAPGRLVRVQLPLEPMTTDRFAAHLKVRSGIEVMTVEALLRTQGIAFGKEDERTLSATGLTTKTLRTLLAVLVRK